MLCPNQGCETEMIPTIEKFSQRINTHLIRIGFWECPACQFTKAIFEKSIQQEEKIIRSIKCHCCNDTGRIYHYLVQEYILSEYSSSDPPVPCKRCREGMKILYGWDIATREDCDRIHRLKVSKIFKTDSDELEEEINYRVIQLAKKMNMSEQKYEE